jgi:hypothetical protein
LTNGYGCINLKSMKAVIVADWGTARRGRRLRCFTR